MKLIGFNFSKISVEKMSNDFSNLNINTNVNIQKIEEVKTDLLKTKETFIGVKFSFLIDYSPEIAKLELTGTILVGVDPKQAKEVLKQWADKKIPEEFNLSVFNIILRKSNLRAMQLEEEMNLPLHIQLPEVRKELGKEEK